MANKLKRRIQQVLGKKQNRIDCQVAVIGNTSGMVDVPGRDGYIYVQVNDVVTVVRNTRVAAAAGMFVLVGKDPTQPNLLQVLDTYSGNPAHSGTESLPAGSYAPAAWYSWMHPDGGQDPVFVHLRQMMPGRVSPSTGLTIKVYRGYLMSGVKVDSTTIDLTAHIPGTAGKVRWVLVYVDSFADVQVVDGSEVDLADLAYTDIPAPPVDALLSLAAVRLFNAQTEIVETRTRSDILDLRWPMWHRHGWDSIPAREAAQDSYGAILTDSGGIDIVYVEVV